MLYFTEHNSKSRVSGSKKDEKKTYTTIISGIAQFYNKETLIYLFIIIFLKRLFIQISSKSHAARHFLYNTDRSYNTYPNLRLRQKMSKIKILPYFYFCVFCASQKTIFVTLPFALKFASYRLKLCYNFLWVKLRRYSFDVNLVIFFLFAYNYFLLLFIY